VAAALAPAAFRWRSRLPAVAFEKPRGKPYHGKMKALVDNVRAGGVKV